MPSLPTANAGRGRPSHGPGRGTWVGPLEDGLLQYGQECSDAFRGRELWVRDHRRATQEGEAVGLLLPTPGQGACILTDSSTDRRRNRQRIRRCRSRPVLGNSSTLLLARSVRALLASKHGTALPTILVGRPSVLAVNPLDVCSVPEADRVHIISDCSDRLWPRASRLGSRLK